MTQTLTYPAMLSASVSAEINANLPGHIGPAQSELWARLAIAEWEGMTDAERVKYSGNMQAYTDHRVAELAAPVRALGSPSTRISTAEVNATFTADDFAGDKALREQAKSEWKTMTAQDRNAYSFNESDYVTQRMPALRKAKA